MNDSGTLYLERGYVGYRSELRGEWRLRLCDLRLIGEFTNQSGPFDDDWFLVFFVEGGDDWYSASFYAQGREEVWAALVMAMPDVSIPSLCDSADFASRVLWPSNYAGRPIFDFRPMRRGSRVWDRLLDRIFPPFVVETVLREEFRA